MPISALMPCQAPGFFSEASVSLSLQVQKPRVASKSLLSPLHFQQAPPGRALNRISLRSTQGWKYAPERTPRFLNDQSSEAQRCHRGLFPCLVCGPSLEFHTVRMVSLFLTTQEAAPCLAYRGGSETACIRHLNLRVLSTHPCLVFSNHGERKQKIGQRVVGFIFWGMGEVATSLHLSALCF